RSRVFDAVMDRQQTANSFTDPDLTAIWTAIKQTRSPAWAPGGQPVVGNTYGETNQPNDDRPFRSFGAPFFQAGGNLMLPTDAGDTIMRSRPADRQALFQRPDTVTNPQIHPYLAWEPLRKALNGLTTVSDNYVVVMTVGFFEVRDGDPANPANPPVLGK